MLETQIGKHTALAAAGADADGEREAGNDLKSGAEIDRGSQSWRQEKFSRARGLPRTSYLLRYSPDALEHEVEVRVREPDHALAERETPDGGGIAERVERARRVGDSGVRMRHEAGGQLSAERKLGLAARSAGTERAAALPRWNLVGRLI